MTDYHFGDAAVECVEVVKIETESEWTRFTAPAGNASIVLEGLLRRINTGSDDDRDFAATGLSRSLSEHLQARLKGWNADYVEEEHTDDLYAVLMMKVDMKIVFLVLEADKERHGSFRRVGVVEIGRFGVFRYVSLMLEFQTSDAALPSLSYNAETKKHTFRLI